MPIVTTQKLIDADKDADSLDDFVSGNGKEKVNTRRGKTYFTAPGVERHLLDHGMKRGFSNIDELKAYRPTIMGSLAQDMETRKVWRWDGAAWNDTGASELDRANEFTIEREIATNEIIREKTKNISEDQNVILDEAVDANLQTYRYTDAGGGLHVVGLNGSVQENISNLHDESKNIPTQTESKSLIDFEDKVGNVIAHFDDQSNLNLSADLLINNKSIIESMNEKIVQVNYQNILIQKFEKIKKLVPIATKNEDNLIKRMPFAIKTKTGLLYFYHKQIDGFDGDGTGSELWKAIISIDKDLNVKVESRELFLAPDEPRGIVKHPTLGRTSDNRILLIYEKRLETTEPYTRFQCYSSDEGLTFTEPKIIDVFGIAPSNSIALGTTGTIVTARNNRMIVPLYVGSACFCMYSDDDGMSWRYSGRVSDIGGYEPSISVDMDNNLIMDIRPLWDGPFYRSRAKSTDNGITWLVLESQKLPSASSQGVIFRDESIGAMIQAHATNLGYPRTKYKLFLSYDNAVTFPFSYQPFDDGWYGGYSQMLKWEDGIYIIVIEYADNFTSLNSNENAGLLILTLSEILSNVSRN